MKNTKKILFGMLAASALFLFSACDENNVKPGDDYGILPSNFKVDVPASLTTNTTMKSAQGDTLSGNDIYGHLANFIAIGEGSAEIVEAIIFHIRLYNIESVIDLTYTSDEDFRVKHLAVEADAEFDGRTWEYQLTITDVLSEGNADGGKGMQVFWNNNPIEGISIIKPYNLNRTENENAADAIFRIDYSEVEMGGYESHMIVSIVDLPVTGENADPFSVNNLKMFVGKKGDIVDVYGNSNHPNAQFFTDNTGFNWAFVASGSESANIGVAEVGLPASTLDSDDRSVLLEEYSILNVLTAEINQWFLDEIGIRPSEEDLANYLQNAEAPGYFNKDGFVQAGNAPAEGYDALESSILELAPFNPKYVSELAVSFK
ncbi:MAG: hypothetical protein IPM71_04345 [Bacteroidota bacterium]|nr:MAG: hypothetical protein IPM71_04345 [Bacteroidota bacterium]